MADHADADETATAGRRRARVAGLDSRVYRVAVVETRRSLRRLLGDPAALVSVAVLALGTAGVAAGLTAVALAPEALLTRALAAADLGAVDRVTLARATLSAAWVGLTGAVVSRTVSVTGRLDGAAAVLLALTPRRAARGVVGAEWLRAAAVLGPAVALSAVTAGRLAGPGALTSVGLAGGLLLGSVVAAGYPLGLALRAVIETARRRGVGWGRLTAAVVAVAGGLAGVTAVTVGLPAVRPLAVGAALPPGGLADLALGPVGVVETGERRALAGVGWALAGVGGGPLVAGRLAEWLWLVDPPRSAATEHPGGLARVPAPPGARPVRTVVRVVWLRTARAPVKLVYTLYPVGGVVALLVDPAARANLVASLFVYVPLYAAWAGGAGLGLNPLGDEGAGLPTALTAVDGRSFVRGHVLAAALPAAAVGTAAVVAGVALGGVPAVAAAVGAVVAVALSGQAAAVAVAVGSVLPGFDSVRVAASTRIVVPSFGASVVYFLALAVLSTPGTLALLAVAGLPTLLPGTTAAVAGVAVQTGLALLAVVVGGRFAAARFDRYRIDG